jgi:phosphodiesterase/alkaline phosphatase D-like protein
MRSRSVFLAVLVALVIATFGVAQQSPNAQQNPNVQITKGPTIESVTPRSAVIAWSTNTNSGSTLRYGTSPDQLAKTAQVPWGGLTHRVTLQNLQPNTTYYFTVESMQGEGTGTGAASGVAQFKTPAQ